jgi:putative sigma-54 modulation protein
MNIEITGRNFEVTDAIRELIDKKLAKLNKYFDDIIEVRCVLQVEKYRHICEIMIAGKEHDTQSAQEADTMPDAINGTIDHLKIQAQKNRKKITDHHRGSKSRSVSDNWTVSVLEPGNLREAEGHGGGNGHARRPRIIRTTDLPIRPMSIEHAALLLDDSRNEFIVFRDLDNERVSVLYKRRDDTLGLIAPEC